MVDDRARFEVGLAWRTRDAIHRPAIEPVVAELRPADGELPDLG